MKIVHKCPHCREAFLMPVQAESGAKIVCPTCSGTFDCSAAQAVELIQAIVESDREEISELPDAHEPIRDSENHDQQVSQSPPESTSDSLTGTLSSWQQDFATSVSSDQAAQQTTVENAEERADVAQDDAKLPSLESLLSSFRSADAGSEEELNPESAGRCKNEPAAVSSKQTISVGETLPEFTAQAAEEIGAAELLQQSFDNPSESVPTQVASSEPSELEVPTLPSFEIAPASEEPALAVDVGQDVPQTAPAYAEDYVQGSTQPSRRVGPKLAVAGASIVLGLGLGWGILAGLSSLWSENPTAVRSAMAKVPQAESAPLPPAEEKANSLVEQATFETPVVASIPEVAPDPAQQMRPLGSPTPFSVNDLRTELPSAEQARELMSSAGLTSHPESARELGVAYAQLCQLAEVLTYLEPQPNVSEMSVLEAKEVFHRLLQHEHVRQDTASMAHRWIAWTGRPHGGIVLAGKLVSAERRGKVLQYQLELAPGQSVVVLTDEPINPSRFLKATAMGVVGSIIDNPKDRLPGYTGNATRAIWAGHTVSLGEPKFE